MKSRDFVSCLKTNYLMQNGFKKLPQNVEILFIQLENDLAVLEIIKDYFKQVFELRDDSKNNLGRKDLYFIQFKRDVKTLQITNEILNKRKYELLKELLEND